MNTASPLFVLGYMRSGTTLVFNILGKHPAVFTLEGEPKIIEYLSISRQKYPDLHDDRTMEDYISFVANVIRFGHPLKYFGLPLIETTDFSALHIQDILATVSHRDYLSVFRNVYDFFASRAGKSRWCIKAQVVNAATIISHFPDARFIEIVRDPRDVLASKKYDRDAVWHSERYRPEQRATKDLFNTYDPLWDSISWKAEIRAGRGLQDRYSSKFYSVRYEDLVSEPVMQIQKLCNFVGLDFSERMLEINERNSSVWDKKYTGIGSESVRKWQKNLTRAEVVLCQLAVKSEMNSLGYDIVFTKLIDKLKALALLLVSIFEFHQRLMKRYKLGGWSYLLNVITVYWKKLVTLK